MELLPTNELTNNQDQSQYLLEEVKKLALAFCTVAK